jgi:pimeloyl-ACP methyl ester carboxylesterase
VTVVVLHDLGDPDGGARWRAVAPADWIVPDLPGHGAAPPPRSGHYDVMSAVAIARWTLAPSADSPSTLVGVGQNALAALVHAAAGGCDRVVIVDGLGGPWRTPEREVDALYATLRAIAADRSATDPAPATGLDPRARYGYALMSGPGFARRFWGAIDQPVLAVETPRSETPADARVERAGWFGGTARLVELETHDPVVIVDTIAGWVS